MPAFARSLRVASRLLVLCSIAVAVGCGESDGLPRKAVSGAVKLDGQPLANGNIQFLPNAADATGMAITASGMIANGSYAIPQEQGPIPGTYKVFITADSGQLADDSADPGGIPKAQVNKDLVPPKYNANTELEITVTADGSTTFDFDLSSK